MLQSAFSIVNLIWLGTLGAAPLAAANAAAFVVWAVDALAAIVSVGTNAVVARHVGAGETAAAREATSRAVGLALAVSAITTIGGLLLVWPIFDFMNTDPEVTELGRDYLEITFLSCYVVFIGAAVEAGFRARGDTRTPMKLLIVSLAANAILDPFLILGIGPFPRLGVRGAALATAICRTVAAAVGLWLLYRRGHADARASLAPHGLQWRIARIGVPIAVSQVSFCLVYMALTRVIAEFGTPAVAAVGIGHKSESIGYFVSLGFAYAASTMVGQNLGAGRPDRARRAAWIACGIASAVSTGVGVLMFVAPAAIVHVFSSDPAVVDAASRYLVIVAISEIFLASEIVFEGAFGGAGDTVPPLIVAGPLSVARVPVAYLLAVTLGWGTDGVWWAISLSTVLKGALMAVWFGVKYRG